MSTIKIFMSAINHWFKPQSKIWKQFPQQAEGYYTLRFAGLFNLLIPIRLAFGIVVSRIEMSCFLVHDLSSPIGNPEGINLRAIRALKEINLIATEDMHHTKKLLN